MSYKVQLAQTAKDDLQDIFSYIAFQIPELNSLQNAKYQIMRIEHAMQSLNDFPNRYPIASYGRLHENNVRIMPIDNYLMHYIVDDNTYVVHIVRILSNRRNIAAEKRTFE